MNLFLEDFSHLEPLWAAAAGKKGGTPPRGYGHATNGPAWRRGGSNHHHLQHSRPPKQGRHHHDDDDRQHWQGKNTFTVVSSFENELSRVLGQIGTIFAGASERSERDQPDINVTKKVFENSLKMSLNFCAKNGKNWVRNFFSEWIWLLGWVNFNATSSLFNY